MDALFCAGRCAVDPVDLREKLLALVEPAVRDEGFDVNDVQIGGGKTRPTVQVFVEKAEGPVTIADCATVSRYLSPLLDAEGVMPGPFVLEVSSPGVERALRTARHFEGAVGRRVKIVAEGAGFVGGVLREVREGCVVVVDGATEHVVELAHVKRANVWVPPDELFGRTPKGVPAKGKGRSE
jgi:ribosome maturation factor RimP